MPAQRRYTPQEAAALTGVPLQRLQNAITGLRLGRAARVAADGRRRIDLSALLAFAAHDRLRNVRVAPAALYDAFRKTGGLPRAPIAIDEAVTIDAPRLLAPVVRNIELYEAARERIASDPAVMGGLPVIRGTRLPARTLHARVKGGDSVESILEDYPYLDRETIEAAVLFMEANPARGRPPHQIASGRTGLGRRSA